MRTICYTQKRSGAFQFPFDSFHRLLRERVAEIPRLDREPALLHWLEAQSEPALHISEARGRPARFLVAALLELGVGTVQCASCDRTYSGSQIRTESFEISRGRLDGGGGRRFRCPDDHIVFEIGDWRA